MSSFQAKPTVIETDLGDELVLLDPQNQGMFSLNEVGRVIWKHLPSGLEAAIGQVVAEFEIDEATAKQDTLELVEQLKNAGLLEQI